MNVRSEYSPPAVSAAMATAPCMPHFHIRPRLSAVRQSTRPEPWRTPSTYTPSKRVPSHKRPCPSVPAESTPPKAGPRSRSERKSGAASKSCLLLATSMLPPGKRLTILMSRAHSSAPAPRPTAAY